MIEISNELMYEVLKSIQAAVAEIKATQADHTRQLLRIRDDINSLRSDDLRIETLQTNMDMRLERIERRLNLTDA
jgi:chromosome segregation ATPase